MRTYGMLKKAMFIDDERNLDNGIIVTLNYGWRFSEDMVVPTHVRGFDTMKEAKSSIRAAIKCNCADCVSRQGQSGL